MNSKSKKKKELPQGIPETPEQKEIRLLKRRLERAKRDSDLYEKWWREGAKAHDETRVKLNAVWCIVKANESTESIYKSMYEGAMASRDMYERLYKESQKKVDDWKEKYEQLTAQDSKPVTNCSKSDKLSPCDGCRKKSFCPTFKRLGYFYPYACFLPGEEMIKRIKETNFDDYGYSEMAKSMEADNTNILLGHPNEAEPTEQVINKENDQKIQLICIKVDSDGLLDEYSRYTSSGIVKGSLSGAYYYQINELDGDIFPTGCFHISEDLPKIKKTRKKND